jgi:ectoine hydroxylase-related dioxygenase (phytanoyl-CoA dioxygenase family)
MPVLQPDELKSLKERYNRDGYVVVKKVLDPALIEEMRRHINWLLEKNPHVRPEQLHHTLMVNDPFWVRVVRDDRLLDVAEQFIGPNIALFASHYICKRPRDGQAVLWHQDGSYWPLEPMNVVTLWVAVDHSVVQNGCMKVIPGTHRMELQQLRERNDVNNVLNSSIDETLVNESKAVEIILEPGDVSIHHPNVIHGSNANNSNKWRRALTIRYIPTSTRITDEKWPTVFLLRGKIIPEINNYRAYPRYIKGQHMPFRGCENLSF